MSPKALNHFSTVDPVIFQILNQNDFSQKLKAKSPDLYYQHLVESIIGQQLSVKVADVIIGRLYQLFPEEVIQPEQVLEVPDEDLRALGMSYAKIKYVKDLSQKSLDKTLRFAELKSLPDQQVIEELTQVKGIGLWTAEMFLIFSLGREDVFSLGDAGLQRAILNLYALDKTNLKKIEKLVETWKPYRSYASLALWHSLDNMPK